LLRTHYRRNLANMNRTTYQFTVVATHALLALAAWRLRRRSV